MGSAFDPRSWRRLLLPIFLSVSSKSPGPFPFISLPPQLSSYSGMRTQNQNEKGLEKKWAAEKPKPKPIRPQPESAGMGLDLNWGPTWAGGGLAPFQTRSRVDTNPGPNPGWPAWGGAGLGLNPGWGRTGRPGSRPGSRPNPTSGRVGVDPAPDRAQPQPGPDPGRGQPGLTPNPAWGWVGQPGLGPG